jgi:hypothetical protein
MLFIKHDIGKGAVHNLVYKISIAFFGVYYTYLKME